MVTHDWGSACSRSTKVHLVSASHASHEAASVCKSAALAVCSLTGSPCTMAALDQAFTMAAYTQP